MSLCQACHFIIIALALITIIILMEPNQQDRHGQQINTAARTPPYTVLTFAGKNYRVLTHQHKAFFEMSKMWSVFWYIFATFMLGCALILLFQQKIPFILTISQGCLIIFTCFAFYKRNYISQSVFFSSANLLIMMIPTIVLSFLGIKQIIIPFCFLVVDQILISIKFQTKKSQMVAKLLVLVEALVIVLKTDDKIPTQWKDVFFVHIILFMILSICVAVITSYLVYMKLKQNEENLMKQKFPGALLIYFNTIAFCLIAAVPLSNMFLGIQYWIICFCLSLLFGVLGTYIFLYRKEIVIFFCTLNEIKAFNQIISFEPIEGIKRSNEEILNASKKKIYDPMHLYRVSENWMSKNPSKVHQVKELNPEQKNEEQPEEDTRLTDCTICMDSAAEVVWMPCGHLTVCMQCCSAMFDKKNFNCVLCKKTPQQIFIIETSQKRKNHPPLINQINLQISIEKDQLTVNTTNIVLASSQNKFFSKQQQPEQRYKETKQTKKQRINQIIGNKNKLAFLVLEGYNVKII